MSTHSKLNLFMCLNGELFLTYFVECKAKTQTTLNKSPTKNIYLTKLYDLCMIQTSILGIFNKVNTKNNLGVQVQWPNRCMGNTVPSFHFYIYHIHSMLYI